MRFELARVLEVFGEKYSNKNWVDAAKLFLKSGKLIIDLCKEGVKFNGSACSEILNRIASSEEQGYRLLIDSTGN
jgi:hypothetical protein